MNHKDGELLLQELFDGTISPDDHRRLEEALTHSPELQKSYRDYAHLQSVLYQHANEFRLVDSHETAFVTGRHIQLRNRRTFRVSVAAAAAAIIVVGVILSLILAPPPKPILSFRTAPDSTFTINRAPRDDQKSKPRKAQHLGIGDTLNVNQGTIELNLSTGVRAIVSAPAKMTLRENALLSLAEGTGWFHVPPGSEGFQVVTPGLRIVDLGTEFGVISYPGSTDEVHVMKGTVQVTARHGLAKTRELHAGDARIVTPTGRLDPAPQLLKPFLKELPTALSYLHFSFDQLEGDHLPVGGNHPALKTLDARLIQSGDHSPASRLTSGRVGEALSFDGLGDIVTTKWPGVYGSSPLTIACWVNTSREKGLNPITGWGLGKIEAEDPFQWKLVLTGPNAKGLQNFRTAWGRKNVTGARVSIKQGAWHHLTVVFTGDSDPTVSPELRFYQDGKRLVPKYPNLPTPPRRPPNLAEAEPLTVGYGLRDSRRSVNRYFQGALDELFIIEGALSDEQVSDLYENNRYLPAAPKTSP